MGSPPPSPLHHLGGHKSTKRPGAHKHADDLNEPVIRVSIALPGNMNIKFITHRPVLRRHVTCPGVVNWRKNVPMITLIGSRTVPSAVVRGSTLLTWLFNLSSQSRPAGGSWSASVRGAFRSDSSSPPDRGISKEQSPYGPSAH